MKRWGALITTFYGLLLAGLVVPALIAWLPGDTEASLSSTYAHAAGTLTFWCLMGLLVGGEAILVFVPVDRSFKVTSRRHIAAALAVAALAIGFLIQAVALTLLTALSAKDSERWDLLFAPWALILIAASLWTLWFLVFYIHLKGRSLAIDRVVGWMLKGSVLELLIAVPCHVYVRRRGDCSAPFVTGGGIATGVAIMLMAFGPSILFLYKKRLERYRPMTGVVIQ